MEEVSKSNTRPLVIAGGGGLGAEVAWVVEELNAGNVAACRWDILGYVDDDPAKHGADIYGYRVLGSPEQVAFDLADREICYHCAIGDNAARQRMAVRLSALGWQAATLIHPTVVRAKNIRVGEGAYVGPLSILSPNCTVGRHVIINQRVAVGHDATVSDFSNICPGAQLGGFCRVGQRTTVGSNASIHPGRSVGDGAVVGANSLVVSNVASDTSVVGVPARKIADRRKAETAAEAAV